MISGNAVECGCCSSCFLSIRLNSAVAIALDANGNAYIAGNANVIDLATPNVLAPKGIGGWVARVNAAGAKLDYLTYIGTANFIVSPGSMPGNEVHDLAVDAAGNAYIAGRTFDPAFPATAGAFQSKFNGSSQPPVYPVNPSPWDAFVAKLNPQGTAMVWATFLGGSGDDSATGIALDPRGAVYVSGTTASSDFPLTTGSAQGGDFLTVLNSAGSSVTFSARFPSSTVSNAFAVDGGGRVRIADPAGVLSSLTLTPPLPARVFRVANAAGGNFAAAVAPAEVVSVFGINLAPQTMVVQATPSGFMPTSVAGVQVFFGGLAAPLLYVSPTQINAVTPLGLYDRVLPVYVTTPAGASINYPLSRVLKQPAIFVRSDATGKSAAAAVNQDGTPNSVSHPAKQGSIVTIWATGLGSGYNALDGEIATAAHDYRDGGVLVNGKSAEVLYVGDSPGLVAGLVQINFRLPVRDPLDVLFSDTRISLTPSSNEAILYVTP